VSTASRESTAGAPAVRPSALTLLQAGAAIVVAGGFVLMTVRAWGQIERLFWRPAELTHALSAAGSLATTFPGRFVGLLVVSVGLMLAAEYRPRALLRLSTAAWAALGVAGTGAYLLSALDAGSRWVFTLLLAASGVAAGLLLVHRGRSEEPAGTPDESAGRGRLVLPLLVGLVGGLLAVRASIEPVTEWDAVIYHFSFARDWLDSLPGLPHAAGPSVGAELSYNYPALFPAVTVVLASALHLGVDSAARIVSPLAALTVLAVLRSAAPRGFFRGWAASMFLLGSTFFVAYGQWPTAYMLMTMLVALAVARLVTERRLTAASALCLGLAAATGLIGVVIGAIVLVAYAGVALVRRRTDPRLRPLAPARIGGLAALLAAPLVVIGIGSLQRTDGLLFPWITWPSAGDLLPEPFWRFARDEILANSYGQFDAPVGSFFAPLWGVASAGVLAPGGLVLAVVIVLACAVARPGSRRVLAVGGAIVAASVVILVAAELLWLRYFLPLAVAGAALLGVAVTSLRNGNGSPALLERVNSLAYLAAWVAAVAAFASGAAYALAGPNDRTYTAATDYAAARTSAFESARRAADGPVRRATVFGDDARAWRDLVTLRSAGLSVGTFDIRNATTRYAPRLQLDGLAGAKIRGSSGAAVARSLEENGIDAVFVPAWFWEPGPGRDPLADWSPVALWVGSPLLRAVRVYLPSEETTYPSVLYAVGSEADRARVARALDTSWFSIEGPLSTRRTVLPGGYRMSGLIGGRLHWRVAAPVTESGGPSIRLSTEDVKAARGVAVFEPREPTLVQAASFVDCTGVEPWARRSTVDVTFPGSPLGFAYLDIAAPRPARGLAASVRHIPAGPGSVLVRGCGDPTTPRGGVFPARSSAARIIVPHRPGTTLAIAFDYLDTGRSGVSFNLYDGFLDRWDYGVARLARCGSGHWVQARLPVHIPRASAGIETVELGPVVNGRDLITRNLRLVPGGVRQKDCETMRG
jgi:hypothetical protein